MNNPQSNVISTVKNKVNPSPIQHLALVYTDSELKPFLLEDFFQNKITIPLFQRTYCWPKNIAYEWFKTLGTPSKPHLAGKILYKYINEENFIIDGQQRLTTNLILLCALRDYVMSICNNNDGEIDKSIAEKLIDKINNILYFDNEEHDMKQRLAEFVKNYVNDINLYSNKEIRVISRLVPSYVDKESYYQIILKGIIPTIFISENTSNSFQMSTYNIFLESIKNYIQDIIFINDPIELKFQLCNDLYENILKGISIISVKLTCKTTLSQLFLWIQEAELLGQGALTYNALPGQGLKSSDMVRNLFMSAIMNMPLNVQDILYHKLWLDPIESKIEGINMNWSLGKDESKLDYILRMFLEANDSEKIKASISEDENSNENINNKFSMYYKKRKHISSIETTIIKTAKKMLKANNSIFLYYRFLSYIEYNYLNIDELMENKLESYAKYIYDQTYYNIKQNTDEQFVKSIIVNIFVLNQIRKYINKKYTI